MTTGKSGVIHDDPEATPPAGTTGSCTLAVCNAPSGGRLAPDALNAAMMGGMTMTPERAAFIRECAEKTYEELFGPPTAEQIAALAPIIGPAWQRVLERERQELRVSD
jgi:hypothetical protein